MSDFLAHFHNNLLKFRFMALIFTQSLFLRFFMHSFLFTIDNNKPHDAIIVISLVINYVFFFLFRSRTET